MALHSSVPSVTRCSAASGQPRPPCQSGQPAAPASSASQASGVEDDRGAEEAPRQRGRQQPAAGAGEKAAGQPARRRLHAPRPVAAALRRVRGDAFGPPADLAPAPGRASAGRGRGARSARPWGPTSCTSCRISTSGRGASGRARRMRPMSSAQVRAAGTPRSIMPRSFAGFESPVVDAAACRWPFGATPAGLAARPGAGAAASVATRSASRRCTVERNRLQRRRRPPPFDAVGIRHTGRGRLAQAGQAVGPSGVRRVRPGRASGP